jgi:IS5 family transposase
MREKRTAQRSIFDFFAAHDIGRELKAMSDWLDSHAEVLAWVEQDLRQGPVEESGRKGQTVESVLRCALLKQYRQLSYEELAFYLLDSVSFQAFARLPLEFVPKKAALQRNIARIKASTWERINHGLLQQAQQDKIEPGRMIRLDSTVTETPIHAPSDSSLLWDGVRVLVRLFEQAQALPGAPMLAYQDHRRRAKKRMQAIDYSRGEAKKAKLYRDLLKVTRQSLAYLDQIEADLKASAVDPLLWAVWRCEVERYRPLIERVIAQTERRLFQGESVPAAEKIVSLFEPHTDIIVKARRDTQFGHKLNLTTGKSGLILDAVVEAGNPADSARFIPMLERHIEHYGRAPRQAAADGGYASADNVQQAKARGVHDVAFHKKRGLTVEVMTKSPWVYRKLRNFRAGIEAGISCLKRAYGLARCTWKGLEHFKAYVWSAIVAHNLSVFARLKPA